MSDTAELTADTGMSACEDGYLQDGVQLPPRPELYAQVQPLASWGTPLMIETIVRVGEEMAWQLPDADPFLVGDISYEHGGPFEGHRSHRGGLDADIGLYEVGGHQPRGGFKELSPAEFDARANWLFIRAFLDSGNVDRIYLDQSLIHALRAWVRDHEGMSPEEIDRIFPPAGTPRTWSMTGVVQHVPGHRNHMHLRVLCGDGQQAR